MLALAVAALLVSCADPPIVHSPQQPGWVDNQQDSGLVDFRQDGIEIVPADRDTYNALIKIAGKMMIPEMTQDFGLTKLPNGNYLMTYEANSKWHLLYKIYEQSRLRSK